MTGIQKTSLSLLISTLCFGLFAFWAYSGLFAIIETNFFRQKVEESITRQLVETDKYYNEYIGTIDKELTEFFKQDFALGTFRINQSSVENQAFADAIDKLRQNHAVSWIRIFDLSAQLHYSTLISDIKEQTPIRKEFFPGSELVLGFPLEQLLVRDSVATSFVLEPQTNKILFSIPMISTDQVRYGTAIVAVSTKELSQINERWTRTAFGEEFVFLDVNNAVVNMPPDQPAGLQKGLNEVLQQPVSNTRMRIQGADGKSWVVYRHESLKNHTNLLFLVDTKELEFPLFMRIILLVIVFLTVFLITFLLLNLKQDDILVLSDRIKHLQINVLKQYIENKDSLDSTKWQGELRLRREEVRASIKKGLGKRRRKDPAIDSMIDKGWDEILEVLVSKKNPSTGALPMDLSRLEDLVQKVISNYQIQISNNSPAQGAKSAIITKPQGTNSLINSSKVPQPVVVEELHNVEEASDLEELGEISASEELEEIAEAPQSEVDADEETLEEVAEAEELEEMEEITDAEVDIAAEELEETAESEELEEMEEVPDAEVAAEELEEIAETEELEEMEEVAELVAQDRGVPETTERAMIPYYDDSIPSVIHLDLDGTDEMEKRSKPVSVTAKSSLKASELPSEKPGAEVSDDLEELEEIEAVEDTTGMGGTEEIAELEELNELEEIDELIEPILPAMPEKAPVANPTVINEEDDGTEIIPELVPLPVVADLSFFAGLKLSPTLSVNPPANRLSRSSNKAIPIEAAKNLEELQLKCRGNLVLKSIYDYTGVPVAKEWAFKALDSGVVQIPDEIYSRRPTALRDKPLGSLVASIMHDSRLHETPGSASIGGLLRFEPSIEVNPEIQTPPSNPLEKTLDDTANQEQRAFYRSRHDFAQSLVLTSQGLDFDGFLSHFRSDESGKIKAMYTFSKRFKAESAVIVRIEMGGLRVQRVLGLSGECPPWLSYKNGGECLLELNNQPSIAFFNNSQALLNLIDSPTSDFRTLNRIVLVPMRLEGRLSYCLFGYSLELDIKSFLHSYIEELPVEHFD